MIEAFDRWNEEVEEFVPAQRLLVYEVKRGWEPLCDFLGVETPKDKLFPHLNAFVVVLRCYFKWPSNQRGAPCGSIPTPGPRGA
jgi:hypothetical protein